jgi:predicted TIM-barrel fold metal-dependent hydrolase
MDIEFLDCNLNYGPPAAAEDLKCCADIGELTENMERAGISGGLVIKTITEAILANSSLAEDLKNKNDMLRGVWQILPSCTGETPKPHDLPKLMKQNNIGAITINPKAHRYIPRKFVIGDYMEMARERKIPVLLNTSRGLTLEQADDIMQDFPDLTVVLTFDNCWPSDRFLRPFLDAYPNLCLDMTYMLTDSALSDLVKKYPAERILFGSGFPVSYMGAHMPVIKHAEISESDKIKIAGANLKKMLEGACYD